MDAQQRRQANETSVRQFFASWDPAWRWCLILGLRELRRDPDSLGALAAQEANGDESWRADDYLYGPLSVGITGVAVNEAAQHCEDLFALLRFLREPEFFAREMAEYAAGRRVEFGRRLAEADDDAVSRLFLIPNTKTVRDGFTKSEDPERAIQAVEAGRERLGVMLRHVVAFYCDIEDFHVQYKHGLKLLFRPWGTLPEETIEQRRQSVEAPIYIHTNEPVSAMLRRDRSEHVMAFKLDDNQRRHLAGLVEERNILRPRLRHRVDLDDVATLSFTVLRLLRLVQTARLNLRHIDENGQQSFSLPGQARWEQVDARIEIDRTLSLADFADGRPGTTPKS